MSISTVAPLQKQDEKQNPKAHQRTAEAFLWENKRGILADDMGTGKTKPAIRASRGRTIVICPSTTKSNWRREILRERPDAQILILSGTTPSPIEADVDFVVLNYDIAEAWQQALVDWHRDTGDEIHVCRNRRAARFQATLQITWACERRYLLTGTPIVNRPLDLFVPINMLGNSTFGGWKAFVDRYCDAHQTQWYYDTSGASNLDELHKKLYDNKIMVRRMKHEVLTLPQKTRTISRLTVDPDDLAFYATEQALAGEIKANPQLLREAAFECLAGVRHAVGRCKIKVACLRVREFFIESGATEKLVAFAHHKSVREAIAAAVPDAIVLNADTKDRDEQVALFQSSQPHRVFITSSRIGGLGITLTAASKVLFVEFDFTSAIMLQAEDRAHRLGQSRNVSVEYLYANSTVDGFMLALINRKQRIFDTACDGLTNPDYLLQLSKRTG